MFINRSAKNVWKYLKGFNNIVFYCSDPGAYGVLKAVYEAKTEDKDVFWLLEGWAKENALVGDGLKVCFSDILKFDPDGTVVVIGGQIDCKKTIETFEKCKKHGIYSIFIFDHWANFSRQFFDPDSGKVSFPNKILLMDEIARNILLRDIQSINASLVSECRARISIVGHPYIDGEVEKLKNLKKAEILKIKEKWNPEGNYLISFLSEPIQKAFGQDKDKKPALGFNEFTVLDYLSGFLRNKYPDKNIKVLVKPHPRENKGKLKEYLKKCFDLEWELAENATLREVIAVSDEIYGMTSLALILAMKAGKKVASLQPGRNNRARKEQNNPYIESILLKS